jgi:hypothetical protein
MLRCLKTEEKRKNAVVIAVVVALKEEAREALIWRLD